MVSKIGTEDVWLDGGVCTRMFAGCSTYDAKLRKGGRLLTRVLRTRSHFKIMIAHALYSHTLYGGDRPDSLTVHNVLIVD